MKPDAEYAIGSAMIKQLPPDIQRQMQLPETPASWLIKELERRVAERRRVDCPPYYELWQTYSIPHPTSFGEFKWDKWYFDLRKDSSGYWFVHSCYTNQLSVDKCYTSVGPGHFLCVWRCMQSPDDIW